MNTGTTAQVALLYGSCQKVAAFCFLVWLGAANQTAKE
jgi:hypothetical protein